VDGIESGGEELEEMLGEETTVQRVGTVHDEVLSLQVVGSQDGYASEIGVSEQGANLERERWGEGGVATVGVGEQEAVGLHGIRGEQETTGGSREEMVGTFEHGRAGVPPFGRAIADQQAGDVAFDEALVEVDEQAAEPFVGATLLA
jgi:hypothetical protein